LTNLTVLAFSTVGDKLNNTRLAQIRLFSTPGCLEQNLGELGIFGNYINQCETFGDIIIQSIILEVHILGCDVQIFNDKACTAGEHSMTVGQCLSNELSGYRSYKLVCN
ncbi:hypothetical protein BO99DRAFT_314459, partial [Aspergillus violaceofuscus CBS 115571]